MATPSAVCLGPESGLYAPYLAGPVLYAFGNGNNTAELLRGGVVQE